MDGKEKNIKLSGLEILYAHWLTFHVSKWGRGGVALEGLLEGPGNPSPSLSTAGSCSPLVFLAFILKGRIKPQIQHKPMGLFRAVGRGSC